MVEVKDILLQRGATPRVYRNTLVFIAADSRQLDTLKEAVRASMAWEAIVKDANTGRLNLRTNEIAQAKEKAQVAGNRQDAAQGDLVLPDLSVPGFCPSRR